MNLKPNTKIRVSHDHQFHAGREGYFQFMGGPKQDVVVCTEEPITDPSNRSGVYFAIGLEDVLVNGVYVTG